MHNKKILKRLKTDLKFCCKNTAKKKFRSRFGETDLIEEAKKKNEKDKQEREQKAKTKNPKSLIEQFGTDLTKMAKEGKLDPVVGRKPEIKRISQNKFV